MEVFSLLIGPFHNRRQFSVSRVHSSIFCGHCCVWGAGKAPSAYPHPHWRVFVLTPEWRLVLLDSWCCGCCGQPPHPCAPPRTNRNGFFQANLSLSPRRWRQPKCESRGGRRKASSTACHCSAAAAAALEPHQEDLSIPFLWDFREFPVWTIVFAEVNCFLGCVSECVYCECFSL